MPEAPKFHVQFVSAPFRGAKREKATACLQSSPLTENSIGEVSNMHNCEPLT